MEMRDPAFAFRTSDGLTIRYDVDDYTPPWKQPETVILLHAAMGSSRRFYAWVTALADRYRVVRWDMRGHGTSDRPPREGISIERLSQDLVELLDHLGLDSAHIVGSSTGGIIGMRAAIDHPARFKTLSSFAAIPGLATSVQHVDYEDWRAGLVKEGVASFLKRTSSQRFKAGEVDPGLVEWFIQDSARNDPGFLADFVFMMTGFDFSDRLPEIRCPTLVVVPSNDPVHPMESYALLKAIPDHRFIVYEDKPHNITDSLAERCVQDLRKFLDERTGG